ncbi:MAG TPA: M48 family metallopeptidase [Terriglobales bacterium]|nr:M48 family metallopeptidase [Terriglobales bacterium]
MFRHLVGTPLVAEAKLDWRFAILENESINAYSDAKGRVWVAGGLARLLNEDRGLWAAVLSHEVAHVILRHPNLALKGLHLALPYVFGKVLRDREHRADATGMMLMAAAGYHPDSMFALQQLLRQARGETPKPLAFFSSHPRWETRGQHSLRASEEALAEFEQRWPDAAASPGGPAPLLVFLGDTEVSASANPDTLDLKISLHCRNARGPVYIVFRPQGADNTLKEVRSETQCPTPEDGMVRLVLDAAKASSRQSFRAKVGVQDAEGRTRALSKTFEVRLPAR